MIKLSDQLYISLPLPLDAENSNVVMDGNTMIVETKSEYLLRVDLLSRYLGQEVDFLAPAGSYASADFITKINDGTITTNKYCFEVGTNNEFFLPCVCCGGEGGTGGDVYQAGDNIFTGDNIHEGSEIFNEITYISPNSPTSWTTVINNDGDLVFETLNGCEGEGGTITLTACGGLIIEETITTTGVIIPGVIGDPQIIMTDGTTIPIDSFLTECCEETDPIFTAWDKQTGITIYWSQIIDPPDTVGGEDCLACELTAQDIVNITNLSGTNTGDQNLECADVLHNDLGGLQGGNGIDEFFHLTAAEHAFVLDIVNNGSGVLASHTELTDIGTNTHPQIDAHIADTTIHFVAEDVVAAEEDPIFTAERDALTDTYVTMRGPTTLIDSPMRIDADAYHINGLPIWAAHGNSNTSFGSGNGGIYDGSAVNNVAIGASAGQFIHDGFSPNTYPTFGIYLGNFVKPSANNNINETIIGNSITGNGSNTVTIGNNNVTDNYFSGNIVITGNFSGEKVEYGSATVYITSDESGNMIFTDDLVGREYTLTELLGGAGGGWNLAANGEESTPIILDNTVSFNEDGNILVERVEKDINISLSETGVNPGVYASPNLTIDANGRITAAEDAAGCQQAVADLGTQSTGIIQLDLDSFPNAIITLSEGADVTIDLDHLLDGDTGHIEVTHGAAATLSFSGAKTVHIAKNSREDVATVLLSPYGCIDVVAYWAAKDKIHLAVIYDSQN